MIFALLAICLFVCCLWYLFPKRHVLIYGRKIPSPPGIPIFGNILIFQGPPQDALKKMANLSSKFPRIMAIWFGATLYVVIYDSKYIEMIFKSRKSLKKADEYKYAEPWLGKSLFISTGETYKIHKKLILPVFSAANLKQYVDNFNKCAHRLVRDVRRHSGKGEFNINPYLSMHMLASGLETVMGTKENFHNELRPFENAIERLEKYLYMRVFLVWLRPFATFYFSKLRKLQNEYLQLMNQKSRDIMEKRKNFLRTDKNGAGDFKYKSSNMLDELLKHCSGGGITENEIVDEIKGFSFAIQESTSAVLGYTLCLLGIHQDVQDKVINELRHLFNNSLRPATYSDVQKMRYLEQVMYEAMRLYPPLPVVALKVDENIELGKYIVPTGSTIVIPIMQLHRDPQQFQNPNKFRPENFVPERAKERNPCSFIPFSLGMRRCIGQKYAMILMKVVLSTFLRHYKVHCVRREEDFELIPMTTMKLKNGFLINIQPRNFSTSVSDLPSKQ